MLLHTIFAAPNYSLQGHFVPLGITNQHQEIQCEVEPVGPTVLKHPLGARWRLLPTLRWVGSWPLLT